MNKQNEPKKFFSQETLLHLILFQRRVYKTVSSKVFKQKSFKHKMGCILHYQVIINTLTQNY